MQITFGESSKFSFVCFAFPHMWSAYVLIMNNVRKVKEIPLNELFKNKLLC